ncbi:hypothetical protein [Fervidobacterium sp.]
MNHLDLNWTAGELLLTAYHWAEEKAYTGPFGGAGPTTAKALDLGLDRNRQALEAAFALAFAKLKPQYARARLALAGAYLALGGHPHNLLAWGFTNLQAAKALARGLTLWSRDRLFFSPWRA